MQTYYDTQINSTNDIHKCTCQFMTFENNIPKGHGTGVLVKIDNTYFILTAAHVIDKHEEELYIRYEQNKHTKIEFELIINKSDTPNRENDQTDIAILKLTDRTTKKINGFYDFLDKSEIGINHKLKDFPLYLAYGYPASMTTVKYKKNIISSNPTYFNTMPSEIEMYNKLKCNINKNIIIHYNKTNLVNIHTEQKGTGPDVYGMSGCGLWYVPAQDFSQNKKIKKELIAILIEWPTKDKNYIISTRIDVVTEIIRNIYNLQLPSSHIFGANLDIEDI